MSHDEAVRLDHLAMFIQHEWEILNQGLSPFNSVITKEMTHLITMTDILEYIFLGKPIEVRTIQQYDNIPSRLMGIRQLTKDILDPSFSPGSVTVSSSRIIDLEL